MKKNNNNKIIDQETNAYKIPMTTIYSSPPYYTNDSCSVIVVCQGKNQGGHSVTKFSVIGQLGTKHLRKTFQ